MAEENKRQIAYKVRIGDLLKGKYIKQEGWQPNYILTEDNRQVSRANIIATAVSVDGDTNSAMVDDGSGSIQLRSFDPQGPISGVRMGSIILIIGRPREYGGEIYILPEVIKEVEDKRWIEVRKLEIEGDSRHQRPAQEQQAPDETSPAKEEEMVAETSKASEDSKIDKIYALIKEIDNGQGADSQEVIERAGVENAEKIIANLLMEGEIFESAPGKLKVLG